MTIAKNYPGQFDAPYVAGMNVCSVPTSTGRVATTFDQAFEFGGTGETESKIGTQDYLLIAWCPSTTAFFGDGGTSNIPASDKLGGLAMQQFKAADFGTPALSRSFFQDARSMQPMTRVYGSDFSGFSDGGFMWSAEADISLLAPLADFVGAVYTGTLTYGQLDRQVSNGLSIE
jgi:hypothetical protein